jgi:hypothetical protein
LKNKVPSLYHTFYSRDLSETTAHAPRLLQVWLRSVNNDGHFLGRTKYLLCYITSSTEGIYLKLYTYHLLHMHNIWYKYGCDQSITNGTLLDEQITFSTVSRLLFQGSTPNYKSITYCASPTIRRSLVAISQS